MTDTAMIYREYLARFFLRRDVDEYGVVSASALRGPAGAPATCFLLHSR